MKLISKKILPLNSDAKLLNSVASVKITLHRGSPPHRSNRDFESPQDKLESVAITTFGPGYDRSNSRTELTRRTGAS